MADPKVDIELSTSADHNKVDTRQLDVAAAYLHGTETYEPLTPVEERKMIRKMDWILLPMVSQFFIPQ